LAGFLAIAGLTACGDKVTVPATTTTPPGTVVHSVTVSPSSANLAIGDKFTFAASVDADQGVTDRTVTWSSSNTAVATVGTDGTVTAVGAGTASIKATSHADATVSGAAAVTVAAVVPATVTIGQINQTVCTPTCTSVPAVLTNVFGQLDVTLNVDNGTQKVQSVQLLMNCGGADTVVGTQTLAIAPPAAGAEASAAPVTISFNTAAFNATTGAVAFKNGQCTLKAKAITSTGSQSAVSSTILTLNNVDFVSVAPMTTTPSGTQVATATDNNGLTWHAGAVTVTAVPVIYTANRTVATATINLVNVSGGNAQGPGAALNIVANGATIASIGNLTPTAGVISASFSNSSTVAGNVAGVTAGGVGVTVITADNLGNPGPTATANVANSIRLDNRAPDIATVAPTYVPNTQNTTGGWVGSNFVFSTAAGSLTINAITTADSVVTGNPAIPGTVGVDKNTVTTQSEPSGTTTWTSFASPKNLAETSNSTAYNLRLVICDALGNCVNTPTLGSFGVDLTPPFISQVSGPTNNQIFNIGTGSAPNGVFNVGDTSNTAGITASGSQTVGGVPQVLATLAALKPSGSTSQQTVCDFGTATGTAPAVTCKSASLVSELAVPTTGTSGGTAVSGQYTLMVTAIDQAGNTAAPITLTYYNDILAPAVSGGVAVPQNIIAGSSFTSGGSDNMDVAAGNGYLDYPATGGLTAAFRVFQSGSATPAGVAFDNVLVRTSTASTTMTAFYRSLQNTIGAQGPKPDIAGIRVIDAANNLSIAQQVALPPTNISGPPATPPFVATGTSGITAWSITGASISGTPTPGITPNPVDTLKTVTINARAAALNLTSASPFAGGGTVCFYIASPTGTEGGVAGVGGAATGELIQISTCQATAVTNIDAGGNRFFDYTITWQVPKIYRGLLLNVYAIGSNTSADGLITATATLQVNP
jgi:hypothetical protein